MDSKKLFALTVCVLRREPNSGIFFLSSITLSYKHLKCFSDSSLLKNWSMSSSCCNKSSSISLIVLSAVDCLLLLPLFWNNCLIWSMQSAILKIISRFLMNEIYKALNYKCENTYSWSREAGNDDSEIDLNMISTKNLFSLKYSSKLPLTVI